jgi:hypothetical protein
VISQAMAKRWSAADILSREPPPPPTISPIAVPSLEDLAREPAPEPKPRKPPRRAIWLSLGLLFGLVVGFFVHDRLAATRAWGWVAGKGHAIHEYFSPSSPGAIVAVGASKPAASPSAPSSPPAPPSAHAPPATSSPTPASSSLPAASGAATTLRVDDLPKAKH